MSGRATVIQSKTKAEGSVFVNSFLSEITQSHGRRADRRPRGARRAGRPTAWSTSTPTRTAAAVADESSIAVVGSGNLGLVWFTGNDHRLTVEELEERHPGLVAAVAGHPGVAMLLVRSQDRGAVVLGPNGHALPRRGPRRGRGPDDPVRAAHDHEPQARGRDGARARPAPAQPVRPGARRGRGVRGAHRLARRPRRAADRAVHPASGRVARSTRRCRSARRPSIATSGAGCRRSASSSGPRAAAAASVTSGGGSGHPGAPVEVPAAPAEAAITG